MSLNFDPSHNPHEISQDIQETKKHIDENYEMIKEYLAEYPQGAELQQIYDQIIQKWSVSKEDYSSLTELFQKFFKVQQTIMKEMGLEEN